jgi:hypothetical protein
MASKTTVLLRRWANAMMWWRSGAPTPPQRGGPTQVVPVFAPKVQVPPMRHDPDAKPPSRNRPHAGVQTFRAKPER